MTMLDLGFWILDSFKERMLQANIENPKSKAGYRGSHAGAAGAPQRNDL